MPGPGLSSLLSPSLCALLSFAPPVTATPAEAPGQDPSSDAQPAEAPTTDAATIEATPAEVAPTLPAAKTYQGDPLGVREYVLDNGLTVLLSENHTRPEVFGAIAVRTGGANDPADDTGMAHYLEHMLFKGTTQLGTVDWSAEAPLQARLVELYDQLRAAGDEQTRARIQAEISSTVEQTYALVIPNELDRMLGEIGSTGVNAFTDEDQTVYHNTFPASQIQAWLAIYAHRFQDPVFRLFPTELEAVYEEKNISIDRFETGVYEAFVEHAWPQHPYGTQQVIGEIEHLKRPSLSAMRRYFDTYYVANNMVLVLSGDFDSEAILPLIQETFAALPTGPTPPPPQGSVAPFVDEQRFSARLTPLRVGAIGYRTVPFGHPDYPALQLARELLYNEQGSGLIDALVDRGKLLIVLPFPLDHTEHGLELLFYAPRLLFQSFARAEALIEQAYARVGAGDFAEADLTAARDNLLRRQDRAFEDNEERALAMAESFTKGGGWGAALQARARLQTLTKAEVAAAAATYFDDDRLVMRSRVGFPDKPRLSKPSTPPVQPQRDRRSRFYQQVLGQPAPLPALQPIDPSVVQRRALAPGVALAVNGNPYNQLFALDLEFGVGTEAIPALDVGAPYLARLAPEGQTLADFKRTLTAHGLALEVEVDRQRLVVHVEGPDAALEAGLGLAVDLLLHPQRDEQRFRQLRREVWGQARVERQDPRQVAEALREWVLYGEDSRFLRAYGPREIGRLGPKRALAAIEQARGYETLVRYVGPRDADAVAAVVTQTLPLTDAHQPAVAYVIDPRRLPARDTVYFIPKRGAVQTQVFFAVEGEVIPREQRALADAYDEFMGGSMSGLIFQEIREFRALAYSAWGRYLRDPDAIQDSYFLAYVGCQADKTAEAVDAMLGLIRDFPARAEDLPGVQASLAHALETGAPDFRGLQRALEAWQRQGLAGDPRPERLAGYQDLDFAAIEALFQAQLAGKPIAVIVVGDPKLVDAKLLARWGEVVRVDEKQVFSR